MTKHLIIGGGGHGRVVADTARAMGLAVTGVVDQTPDAVVGFSVPVLGDDTVLTTLLDDVLLLNGIGGARSTTARRAVWDRLSHDGYRFATLVHPQCIMAEDVVLDTGVQVMAGAIVQPGTAIGANSIINTRASVDHDCTIGAHVHIAPGAVLCGGVVVGDGALIGAGSVILPGIRVASGARVGAGSVVTKDVAPDQTVCGNPARIITQTNGAPI